MTPPPRILLGQLSSFGDCLYATAVARQIKHDLPECHLTWAVGSRFRPVLDENPFVDEIWEIPVNSRADAEIAWRSFAAKARSRAHRGEFDQVYLTQINPDNYGHFDGTVRASIFRGYPRPITVPVAPVMRLRDEEVRHVTAFTQRHGFDRYRHRVLFECASASSQSFLTPGFAVETARLVVASVPDVALVLTSDIPIASQDPRIVDGSQLSFRENAELTRHCTLFIGGSSGITWLATSEWAKPLPMIQALRKETSVFASVVHDAEYFGLPTENILELTDCSPEHLSECVRVVLTTDFTAARSAFHESIPVRLDFYMKTFIWRLLKSRRFGDVLRSFRCVARRYGIVPFIRYLAGLLVPARKTANRAMKSRHD